MTKWGGRPHWRFEGLYLGEDVHGRWVGFPVGTRYARPGMEFESHIETVSLFPRDGWFCASFHAPGNWCDLYVDVSTAPVWDGHLVGAVDLDLDVVWMSPDSDELSRPPGISAAPGTIFVDDEDEFADHQVRYGYPLDVIEKAQTSSDQVLAAVRAGRAPFEGTHEPWLRRLGELSPA